MGLGIAIGGSIGALTMFVVFMAIAAESEQNAEVAEVRSEMYQELNKLRKTDFTIDSISANAGSDIFSVSLTSTGSEKLWSYDDFVFLVEYDADILGTSTKIIERMTYNETASFSQPVVQQIARPDSDDSTGTWTTTPLYQKLDETNPNDSNFVSNTPDDVTSDTGFQSPTNTGDDHNQWTNPTNAFASDDIESTETATGDQQDWYDFGLSVPPSISINGIEVNVEAYRSGLFSGGTSIDIDLSWDGGTSYTTVKGATLGTATNGVVTFGDSTDTWGRTWNSDDFSNANFRLRLEKTGGGLGSTVNLDHIEVRVYYTTTIITSTAEVGLETLSDPLTDKGHILRLRENGGNSRTVTVSLVEGGSTVITTGVFSSTDSYTTREINLSDAEANSIGDYGDLSVRWNFEDSGGSGNANVSWIEFEIQGIPDFDGNSQQWGVNGISEDYLDPGIINPNESLEFGGKLQYNVFTNGLFKVSITADNGKTESSSITV